MQIVSYNDSGDHINDVMSTDKHHHYPLVAHDKKAEPGEAKPALGPRLKHQYEACADVSRVVEIIRIVVGHYQRGEPWIPEQKSVQTGHEKVVLHYTLNNIWILT